MRFANFSWSVSLYQMENFGKQLQKIVHELLLCYGFARTNNTWEYLSTSELDAVSLFKVISFHLSSTLLTWLSPMIPSLCRSSCFSSQPNKLFEEGHICASIFSQFPWQMRSPPATVWPPIFTVQGDPSGQQKPLVDLDLESSVIFSGLGFNVVIDL